MRTVSSDATVRSGSKLFPRGKMGNSRRRVLFPKVWSNVQTPLHYFMFVFPKDFFLPLYNYRFRGKTTSAESGHHLITSEAKCLYWSSPCCSRATDLPSFHNNGLSSLRSAPISPSPVCIRLCFLLVCLFPPPLASQLILEEAACRVVLPQANIARSFSPCVTDVIDVYLVNFLLLFFFFCTWTFSLFVVIILPLPSPPLIYCNSSSDQK